MSDVMAPKSFERVKKIPASDLSESGIQMLQGIGAAAADFMLEVQSTEARDKILRHVADSLATRLGIKWEDGSQSDIVLSTDDSIPLFLSMGEGMLYVSPQIEEPIKHLLS